MNWLFMHHRFTYVDRHTVHVLGDIIPASPKRNNGTGSHIRSALDEERTNKCQGSRGRFERFRKGERTGISREAAKDEA